jgi:ATP synthase subunit 6
MITNIFTIFDPYTSKNLIINWVSIFFCFFIIPYNYWAISNRSISLLQTCLNNLGSELKNNLNKKYWNYIFIFTSLLITIFSSNVLGVIPYIFTATSHLIVSLTLSLPIWITFMLFGWLNNTNLIFTHIIPIRTPIFLANFIVIIETISTFIRPLTLTVRLTANIIAGHLIILLISGLSESYLPSYFLNFLFITITLRLELAIAFIQSYVFITLLSLYLNEIN